MSGSTSTGWIGATAAPAAHSPLLLLVRQEELVQLLAPKIQFVLCVLLDGLVVGDHVVLGGEERLERHHRRLARPVRVRVPAACQNVTSYHRMTMEGLFRAPNTVFKGLTHPRQRCLTCLNCMSNDSAHSTVMFVTFFPKYCVSCKVSRFNVSIQTWFCDAN